MRSAKASASLLEARSTSLSAFLFMRFQPSPATSSFEHGPQVARQPFAARYLPIHFLGEVEPGPRGSHNRLSAVRIVDVGRPLKTGPGKGFHMPLVDALARARGGVIGSGVSHAASIKRSEERRVGKECRSRW